MRIQPWDTATGVFAHDPDRQRKLLLHRARDRPPRPPAGAPRRLALVPLSLYFKDGRVKVEVALARGRKNVDKRQALAKRDAEMDARRELARATSGKDR